MSKTKKTTLDSLTQTNGKITTNIPSTLDAIMAENVNGRYSDVSEAEYIQKLNEMNLPDLQSLAHDKGVMILEDAQRLRNEILKEFRAYHRSQKIPEQELGYGKKYKINAAAAKILSEGK